MFYTIYKITNKLNNKIYIGKHQTKDLNDNYMGSGKWLKASIIKHGLENFTKEIMFQFDNEADMNAKEAELVTDEFVKEDTNYNLCPGGNGGFGYINSNAEITAKRDKYENKLSGRIAANKVIYEKYGSLYTLGEKLKCDNFKQNFRTNVSNGLKIYYETNSGTFVGKKHTEETKKKIGNSNSKMIGQQNSQYGTMWITNGQENKKIKKEVDIIPEGWYKGRR